MQVVRYFCQLVDQLARLQLARLQLAWVGSTASASVEHAQLQLARLQLARLQLARSASEASLQLAHNAIAGEDDPGTLKELYDSLEDVDWRIYSGLDDKALALLDDVGVDSLTEANLDFQTVTMAMLPHEAERAEKAWSAARAELGAGTDEVWLARLAEHDRLLDALDTAGRSYGVSNVATALMAMLDVFERAPGRAVRRLPRR